MAEYNPVEKPLHKEAYCGDAQVEHPSHYNEHPSGVECLDIVRHMGFNLGNAMKYIWRADLKHDSPKEDLEKAIYYLKDEIGRLAQAQS